MSEQKKNIVLVVDDNPDDRRVFSRYLKEAGFEIDTACNVKEGVETTTRKEFDCILLDYNMPAANGIEMLKKIKQDEKLKFIPVIMLTGLEQEENILNGLESGADDYVGKSSSREIIIARVKASIRIKNLHDEIKKINDKLQKTNTELTIANEEKSIALNKLDNAVSQLREISVRDSLTKLYNHGYFMEILEKEVDRAKRYNQNLCCLMIDIDHFKKVNDTYGHLFGDKVLIELAECIKLSLRNADFIARYGGEEFTILLPNAFYDSASIVAEKLMQSIQEYLFTDGVNTVKLTISIGISSLFEDVVLDKDKFLRFADSALYAAKTRGRNTFVMYKEIISDDYFEKNKIKEVENKIFGIMEMSKQSYLESVRTLIIAQESKDLYTKEHSINVLKYAVIIAKELKLPDNEIEIINNSSILHDLGKIGISEYILLKNGKLTNEEYDIVKRHPVIGVNILQNSSYIRRELNIIVHHHERYDGKGYPDGLKGKSIPLGSRIIAVADSFDAMSSNRPYRKEMSLEKIINELILNSGTQFDPKIVYTFLTAMNKKGFIPPDIKIEEKLKEIKEI